MNPTLESEITCPACRGKSVEAMPEDACIYFYECKHCGQLLKPVKGDCCVFCSYGTVKCPPVQLSGRGCCAVPIHENDLSSDDAREQDKAK